MINSLELAKLAGVSQSTVSRCLNDSPLVSEKTKERIKKLAAEHNFEFNSSARGLKTSKTGIIGYVFSEDFSGFANHYIQSDLYYGIRSRLINRKLDLMPVFDYTLDGEMPNIEKCIRNRRVDGLIINRGQIDPNIQELLEAYKIPYIFIYDTSESSPYNYVISPNHKQSGYLVGSAFCNKGYNDFVEVLGPCDRIDVKNKHDGFAKALSEKGFELTSSDMLYGNYKFEDAFRVTMESIERFKKANACFVQNDTMAIGVIEALKQNSIRVPEDIAIIGYDDIPMAKWCKPYLSTISISYERIISVATEWIVELIQNLDFSESRKITLNGELIIRDTFK
ncbi:LacI family DNA-binding transcriptional regulator [Petroclostridium sp. X23]|uniref:LacI family DNA-binding transcriptional regulator n=1 Tax=Petroclostridium sp. X23 TaxID=3045146 RepID=UPI0024ACE578|nr:LacI family DNA-binding transcriptional regulator [Petroclostridium sp. X23]WHH58579.1 LacI family DNA-binding transcriptional regulator [Petroclostridium sp. X23]